MCGLVGYLGPGLADPQAALQAAADRIRHRGPDDEGYWADPEAGLFLAFRRLAIQDLTPAGHQPMASVGGRHWIVFNGEIYNHLELRARLQAEGKVMAAWRGHSDTETLLACFEAWGIEATLQAAIGMFAIALWDRQQRRLVLARDRFGEKPLYWGRVGRGLAFASELKALRRLPGFDNPVDRQAVAGLVGRMAAPFTSSIYEGIRKVEPGTWLEIEAGADAGGRIPESRAYWRLSEAVRRGQAAPLKFDDDRAAVDSLERCLSQAVQSQLISDVPLGAFLSGGIDSSTIVALMQKQRSSPVKTFSIGFHEEDYNEADHARSVARHLGTDHHELYVDDAAARELIPRLPEIYCEPFADMSQIPTLLVSQMAREHVTVSLSGDAGDELFGGYQRYFDALALWGRLGRLPRPLRSSGSRLIAGLSAPNWDRLLRLLPARHAGRLSGDRILKGAQIMAVRDFPSLYRRGYLELWPSSLVEGLDPNADGPRPEPGPERMTPLECMMYDDAVCYLPDDILVKVDRAAMATSLESRVPMLDVRVAEFAWSLGDRYRIRDGVGKWLLRQVLYRHVPQSLVDRPKMGFGVPVDSWLRGPLRPWAEDLLDPIELRRTGMFRVEPVRQRWQEHLSGARNWQFHLWAVLMYQAWARAQAT